MTSRNLWLSFGCTLALAVGCGGEPPPVTPDAGGDAGQADAGPPECPAGTELCGDECVNTDESRANCGGCGAVCGAGEACVEGACDVVCPSTQTECGDVCADTTSDRLNCGGCGVSCTDGEICEGSACVVSCPGTQTVCGTVCADTQSDPAHCGGCDMPCDPGAVCSAGTCTATCAAGLTQCGASCVETDNDPMHCGGCDTACTAPSGATGLCVAGTCRATCDPLVGDCNADLGAAGGDGCETPLATDADNCGACGRSCSFPAAMGGCAAGVCSIAGCESGFDDCDGVVENGCEAELAGDVLNCGACGSVCGAGEGCFGGVCAPIAGEDCSDPIVLAAGANTVYWTATANDYFPTTPSCVTVGDVIGPDVTLAYTATANEEVSVSIAKPANNRFGLLVSTGTCAPGAGAECVSEYTDPTIVTSTYLLRAGETLYVHLIDTDSGALSLSNPLDVTVSATAVPCVPGSGGLLDGTVTRIPTSLTSSPTEYYVAADASPTGYVYVGGLTSLYRTPKAGGTTEDVAAAAGLTDAHLGYAMLVDGDNIYTINSATSGISGHLWRISTTGGTTWSIQDYAFFPSPPLDDIRAGVVYGGRIYLLTSEAATTTATQIWSVDAAATTLPTLATLEASFTTEADCTGIDRDATHYYLACDDGGNRIVRLPIGGSTTELLVTTVDVSATRNSIWGDDTDGDGAFDVLYTQSQYEEIGFACGVGGATPYGSLLTEYGGASASYGMAYDRAAGVLWAFDDDTRELVRVE